MNIQDGKIFAFENLFWNQNILLDFIKVMQISEVILEPNGQIFEHKQLCNEITYIVSGYGYFYNDGELSRLGYGDIHIVSTGQMHRIIGDANDKLRFICIGFDFSDVPDDFKEIAEFFSNASAHIVKSEASIRNLFDMLINEFYHEQHTRDMALEHIIKLILIKIFERYIRRLNNSPLKLENKKANSTVYKIIKYIDTNIYNVKTVRDIAIDLNFTENYISHLFKSNMGISLSQYIKKEKLKVAKTLLETKNITLTEVAKILNFDSVQSLSRAFKQEYNQTPTEFLKFLKTD